MKLPKNNYALNNMFKTAPVPDISEFSGEYFVHMLTGLPSLRRFSHRKVFYTADNKILGHNLLFASRRWGNFYLREGVCPELDSLKAVVIDYQRPGNTFISHRIVDYIRSIEKGSLYLGRFNYTILGRPLFLGYFSLAKK